MFGGGKKEQNQTQINKQKVKQKQDQKHSNETMARMLSSAEIYAIRMGCPAKTKYQFYDHFDNGFSKDIYELKSELIFEIEIFRNSYKDFVNNNKEYIFPSNSNKKSVLQDISLWGKYVNNEDKKYYQAMYDILCGKKTKSFEKDLIELEKNNPNYGKMDVYDQMEVVPKVMDYISRQNEDVEKKMLEKGDYDVNLNLYEKPENDIGLRSIRMGTRNEYSSWNNMDGK